jgi:hypothetical protein
MGYYTNYTLSILNHDELEPDIDLKVAKALANLDYFKDYDEERQKKFLASIEDNYRKGRDPIAEVVSFDSHKWYEHEEDMKEIAAQFPQCIFELEGEGEESGDLWKEWYCGNKFKQSFAEITYDEPSWIY